MTIQTNNNPPWPVVEFLIDEEDYSKVTRHKWYCYGSYVQRHSISCIYLHVFIMGGTPDGFMWDHKDRNKLNCQKDNLELITRCGNNRNRSVFRHNTSGYSGVRFIGYLDSGEERWEGSLRIDNQSFTKQFKTKDEAIRYRKDLENMLWVRYPDSIK